MLENRQTERKTTPDLIIPTKEREQADKAVSVARRMEDEAKRFAITYMRAYQCGFRSGMECARKTV